MVHICFGYAAVVKQQKPSGYSFLPQLADTIAQQISIEAAQPKLDLGVLRELSGKQVMLGVLDLGDPAVETAETVADRIRAALKYLPAERLIPAPDCGMKYLPRATAFGKLKALAEGRRDRAARAGGVGLPDGATIAGGKWRIRSDPRRRSGDARRAQVADIAVWRGGFSACQARRMLHWPTDLDE